MGRGAVEHAQHGHTPQAETGVVEVAVPLAVGESAVGPLRGPEELSLPGAHRLGQAGHANSQPYGEFFQIAGHRPVRYSLT